jgi:ketosteroid isomerase-like protein
MRSAPVLLTITALCALTLGAPVADSENAELLERINEANDLIDQASIEDDYETVASFYTEDVVVLPNNEPMIVGRDAFIENEKAAREAGFEVVSINSTIVEVFTAGELIHEIGTYEVTLTVPGPPYPITDTGKYLVIWEVQPDDSLQIKLEMWNNDEPPDY